MIGHLFSLRGVTAERPVVVYEHDSGVRAARAFWFLEYLGHPNVRLLDGGFGGYVARGLPVSQAPVAPTPSDWHGSPTNGPIASWSDVAARLGRPDTILLDTRSEGEYLGTIVRARRGGTIPGSINLEWKQNLMSNGHFKTPEDLREMYAAAGITPEREVVAYCQGGYRGAHSYVALRSAGFPRVRNYLGSWKEWGDRDDLPIEHPQAPR
jgi:thiosulfate/3-mercaptopyruvate sulfurtransferase